MQAQRKKEAYLASVDFYLHKKDNFLYYKEDDMPNMAKLENSLLRYKVPYIEQLTLIKQREKKTNLVNYNNHL